MAVSGHPLQHFYVSTLELTKEAFENRQSFPSDSLGCLLEISLKAHGKTLVIRIALTKFFEEFLHDLSCLLATSHREPPALFVSNVS